MLRYSLAGPLLGCLRLWQGLANHGGTGQFRILILHNISQRQIPSLDRLLTYLNQQSGLLTPDEAEARLTGGTRSLETQIGSPPTLLSFDDGFASNLYAARTVLADHGAKALFFVCPGLIDLEIQSQRPAIAANIFDGNVTAAELPLDLRLMTWDEIQELRTLGHGIGAHGMSHQRLSGLHGDDLSGEIIQSAQRLRHTLGVKVAWFAYAFGDLASISKQALAAIQENFTYCRSGVRGINGPQTGNYAIRADQIDLDWPEAYLRLVVEGGLSFRYQLQRWHLDSLAYN